MTLQHDRPRHDLPLTHARPAAGTPAGLGAAGQIHASPPADNTPPKRSKVTAGLAVLACAACCALPVLIAAGILTGAGAALAENILLATAGILLAAAAGMWWLHQRRTARTAAAGTGGCASGSCAC